MAEERPYICGKLKDLRMKKGAERRKPLTQKEVAIGLGMDERYTGTYRAWERNTVPPAWRLPDLARYYGVSIDSLFGYEIPSGEVGKEFTKDNITVKVTAQLNTREEKEGTEALGMLLEGETVEAVAEVLNSQPADIDRRVRDIIYRNLVRIDIGEPQKDAVGLQRKLEDKFPRLSSLVVFIGHIQDAFLRTVIIGRAAAQQFIKNVTPGSRVGIAGGFSVSRMIRAIPRGECPSIHVYPLCMLPAGDLVQLSANTLAGMMAYDHFPEVTAHELPYATLEQINQGEAPLTRRALMQASTVNVAYMGIGSMEGRRVAGGLLRDLLLDVGITVEKLQARGVIGDVLLQFIGKDGQPLVPEIDERICSIGLDALQDMVRYNVPVTVIASGEHKRDIIRVAIKSHYVNSLIIDDVLAEKLLEDAE